MANAVITANLTIDCLTPTCISFTDTTKSYSSTNLTGYNSPNQPVISEITSVTWLLTIGSDVFTFTTTDSAFFPNALGTNEVCLLASYFDGLTEFTKGSTYLMDYIVSVGSDEYSLDNIEFLFSCCGSAITSGLGTNFTVTEETGCTAIVFSDTTGTYDATDNTGGYGSPNFGYDDITETLITITRQDGTVISITDFIPTEAEPTLNISSATLGYADEVITSQVMEIAYSVYTEGKCRIGYKDAKIFFRCSLESCIRNRNIAALTSCDKNDIEYAFRLTWEYNQILIASQGSIGCGVNKIAKLIRKCSIDTPNCG